MTPHLRFAVTYIVPMVILGSLILCGLWIVPDSLFGMYANIDGKWGSWNARAILEWSTFLDFGPYSPLTGTGSLFLPNLPWLNPGALALAIPAGIEYKHLFSYIIYLMELVITLYLLFLELNIQRGYASLAIVFYLSFFFIPFPMITDTWALYSMGPFYCHQFAVMNLATIAFLRSGLSTFRLNIVWGLVFIVCLFIAFASAPITNLFYMPVYSALWGIVSLSSRIDRRAILFRLGLLLITVAVFSFIGLPSYMSVTAAVSARDNVMPPFLHPGMALLTLEYWEKLVSRFSFCGGIQAYVMLCPKMPLAWVQIAALIGGGLIIVFDKGRRRALAITVISMIFLIHFYFLLQLDFVLGRIGILGYTYIYWTLFPLLFAVPVAAIETIARFWLDGHASLARWIPGVASTGIAVVCVIIFVEMIVPRQPPMATAGTGVLGLPPIAHGLVHKGAIHQYLEKHIALAPGKTFEGYAALHLARDDGFMRKYYMSSETAKLYLGQPDEVMLQPYQTSNAMGHLMYQYAHFVLWAQFGNMFQLTDFWNSNIPTFEEHGQWLTKQMFVFNSDLMADTNDVVDSSGVSIQVYKFAPEILAMLGVRYLISDGTLDNQSVTEVLSETSPVGTTLRLYELRNANLGNWSPTNVVIADGYISAVSSIEKMRSDMVVLLEDMGLPPDLVPAHQARLTVLKGGYHITARSTGASLLILPVQFSHCFQLIPVPDSKGSVFRANLVQTGISFQDKIDAELRFEFGLTNSSCRRQDADEMYKYFSISRSKKARFGAVATTSE
jgi:hypothetical protein